MALNVQWKILQALQREGMTLRLAEECIKQVTEQMHELLGEAYHSMFPFLCSRADCMRRNDSPLMPGL